MKNAINYDRNETILDAKLQKSPARENLPFQVLASISLFIISFFFIFWIGSYFEVDIFPLENRFTILTTFQTYIFDKFVDTIIITLLTTLWICLSIRGKPRIVSAILYGSITALAIFTNSSWLLNASALVSVPLIVSFFVYHYFSPKKIIQFQSNLLFNFFSLAVLGIAVSGFIITLYFISSSSGQLGWIRNHAVDIFLLFSSISPALILFLMAGSFIKLLAIKVKREFKIKKWQYQPTSRKLNKKSRFLFLSLFMLLSVFIVLLPHQSFINNENELVGSDSVEYVNWLNNIMVEEKGEFLQRAFVAPNSEDRPLSLILFSGVLKIFPDNPYLVIDHLPIILSPLLVLAVFFLTRELTSNDTVSLLASFLTAVSFQTLIGIQCELTNLEVVKTICAILDNHQPDKSPHEKLIEFVDDRPGHDYRYAMDISKINQELGWSPAETFSSGIAKTVQWYIENPAWWQAILDGSYQLERLGSRTDLGTH